MREHEPPGIIVFARLVSCIAIGFSVYSALSGSSRDPALSWGLAAFLAASLVAFR